MAGGGGVGPPTPPMHPWWVWSDLPHHPFPVFWRRQTISLRPLASRPAAAEGPPAGAAAVAADADADGVRHGEVVRVRRLLRLRRPELPWAGGVAGRWALQQRGLSAWPQAETYLVRDQRGLRPLLRQPFVERTCYRAIEYMTFSSWNDHVFFSLSGPGQSLSSPLVCWPQGYTGIPETLWAGWPHAAAGGNS